MSITVKFEGISSAKLLKWKVRQGSDVQKGNTLCTYTKDGSTVVGKLKAEKIGTVNKCLIEEGAVINPGDDILQLDGCTHATVMKDLCALCGANLRDQFGKPGDRTENISASVAMVHSVPELIVSEEEAKKIGNEDQERLLKIRKLALLVDLDQTLLHTTRDNIPANLKDVHHFTMPHGRMMFWYHTKFRPGIQRFLDNISKLYELHICTFGVRLYAHSIARIIDPKGIYFSHRILSRDECFNPTSKTANLRALFPCGDSMVAIIDDREDVWNFSSNLIHVKPYQFFYGTTDINAPPGSNDAPNEPKPKSDATRESKIVKVPRKKANSEEISSKSKDSELPEKEEEKKEKENTIQSENTDTSENTSVSPNTSENNTPAKDKNDKENIGAEKDMDTTEKSEAGSDSIDTDKAQTTVKCDKKMNDDVTSKENTKDQDTNDKVNLQQEKACVEDASSGLVQEDSESVMDGKEDDNVSQKEDGIRNDTKSSNIEAAPKSNCSSKEEGECDTLSEDSAGCDDVGKGTKEKETKNGNSSDEDMEYDEMIEWEDPDDYLLHLEDILVRIHQAFYEFYDQSKDRKDQELPSLKKIIPYVRRKTLQGCNILFSGLPTNRPLEQSRKYIIAESLGANVHTNFVPPDGKNEGTCTTHVVATRPGTQKVRTASKHKKVHVVGSDWLFTCNERWERNDERLYYKINEPSQEELRQDMMIMPRGKRKSEDDLMASQESYGKDAKIQHIDYENIERDDSQADRENDGLQIPESIDKIEDEKEGVGDVKERRFSDSYNPMLTFSKEALDDMDKEVDEMLVDESSDSEEEAKKAEKRLRHKVLDSMKKKDSSSEESLSGNFPRGWKKKKRKREVPDNEKDEENEEAVLDDEEQVPDQPHRIMRHSSDSSSSKESDKESFEESIGSVDEEMLAEVEKQLLGF